MGASCMGQPASLTCGCLIPCTTRDSGSLLVPSEHLQLGDCMLMLMNLVRGLDVQSSHFSTLLGFDSTYHSLWWTRFGPLVWRENSPNCKCIWHAGLIRHASGSKPLQLSILPPELCPTPLCLNPELWSSKWNEANMCSSMLTLHFNCCCNTTRGF